MSQETIERDDMFKDTKAFSGFSADDLEAAKEFYGETLGIEVTEEPPHGLLTLHIAGDRPILVYPKEDHAPATLHDPQLPGRRHRGRRRRADGARGEFHRYEGTEMETDEKGIFREGGPLIAWFEDPAGNVLSLIQQ